MLQHQLMPFNFQSGWIPEPTRESFREFFEMVLKTEPQKLSPSVQALKELIESNDVLEYLANNAFKENSNIIHAHQSTKEAPIPRIPNLEVLLNGFNTILSLAPRFINNDLVGLPFSAFVVGIDATLGGSTLFRLPMFNEKMKAILEEWAIFLDSSATGLAFCCRGRAMAIRCCKKTIRLSSLGKRFGDVTVLEIVGFFLYSKFQRPRNFKTYRGS